jgi:hypothetical protein
MTKSNLTLTQSGLLAVLLQRQRHKVIELAQRRLHRRQVRAPFWSRFRQALCGNRSAPHLNVSPKPIAVPHQIHTYTELRQQIHHDLRIQHPEWVEPNGESPICDSYESRLVELLENFARTGTDESMAGVHRILEQTSN